MGLTPFDVENLNRSIEQFGLGYEQRRQLDMQKQNRDRALKIEERRLKAEEGRENLLGEGKVETTLVGDEGGVFTYSGTPTGLQNFLSTAKKEGRNLRAAPPEAKNTPFSFTMKTAAGDYTVHAKTMEELSTGVEQAKQKFGEATTKSNLPQPFTRKPGQDYVTPGGAFVKAERPKEDTVRDVYQPPMPVNMFGQPFPGTITRTRTTHVPRDTVEPPTAPDISGVQTNAPTTDANALRLQAQQAIQQGKDPAAVRARFKQLTGQDL